MVFLRPIVTFQSPITVFSCKFFISVIAPYSRSPIVVFLSPIVTFYIPIAAFWNSISLNPSSILFFFSLIGLNSIFY